MAKARATKKIRDKIWTDAKWTVWNGELQRSRGNPGSERLFRIVAEKLPYGSLPTVEKNLKDSGEGMTGVYVAHDSMGCPRYIGRGNIFGRLRSRKRHQEEELEYFSFYVVEDKKHEGEIETLLIRAAGFLLQFNERKKRVGIKPGNIRDFEAGTKFYERQWKRGKQGPKKKRKK
jgi:hypothetical protein